MVKIWVLTEEYNDYDQHGSYFVAAWLQKPGREDIARICGVDTTGRYTKADEDIDFILSGGGRIKWESHWWNLVEVEEG